MCANDRLHYNMNVVFIYSHITLISLSSLYRFFWSHWTYKMTVWYILSSMWLRLSQFSQLPFLCNIRGSVFKLPISLAMILRIGVYYLIIKSKVWVISHVLWLGPETIVCAVCPAMFWLYSSINSLALGRSGFNIPLSIFKPISWSFPVQFRSGECHKTSLVIGNITPGNDLAPTGSKPFPKLLFTKICVTVWCH